MTPTNLRKGATAVFWIITMTIALIGGGALLTAAPLVLPVVAEEILSYYLRRPIDPEILEIVRRARFDSYREACGDVPFPSTACPALYLGTLGNTWFDTPDGTREDLPEHPCYAGEIKANRRSRYYHVPGGQFYGVTRADVLCFESVDAARVAGYRPSPR